MPKIKKDIEDILDLPSVEVEIESKELVELEEPEDYDRFEDDFENARRTFDNIISQGEKSLSYMTEVANAGESPRAHEVVGGMIKALSDANEARIKIYERKAKVSGTNQEMINNGVNIDKAVFVGSTADLQKAIKNESK